MQNALQRVLSAAAAAHFGVRLIEAVLVALATLLIASFVRARLRRLLLRTRADVGLTALLDNIAFVAVIAFGVLIVATLILGTASLTALAAVAGASGLALSLAAQDILRNFVAGVYLLLERPFRIGDQVSVRGIDGTVETIQVRTTVLKTATGLQVMVPNAIVFTEVVTNRSAYNLQRGTIRVEVSGEPFEEIGQRLLDALQTVT
ncbi:MAG: mechanosensitive ion channel, partial [Anaerolineales bacterium]|nr:mechanosensitive ion channel [Anaerolineales bacterium]